MFRLVWCDKLWLLLWKKKTKMTFFLLRRQAIVLLMARFVKVWMNIFRKLSFLKVKTKNKMLSRNDQQTRQMINRKQVLTCLSPFKIIHTNSIHSRGRLVFQKVGGCTNIDSSLFCSWRHTCFVTWSHFTWAHTAMKKVYDFFKVSDFRLQLIVALKKKRKETF